MEKAKAYVLSSSSGGDISRTIYELQRRIDKVERMSSDSFTIGVSRISFMLPSIGLKTTF